jgi:O-antigen/teichoic acid export membrane protein
MTTTRFDDRGSADSKLKSLALVGAIWTVLRMGGMQIIRLAGNLTLTRLLPTEAFGLMALVSAFMQGLVMFSDVGLGPSIVRSERGDDPSFQHTAFSVQVVRSWLMFALSCGSAAFCAAFYDEESLRWLIPLASVGMLLEGFRSIRFLAAGRDLAVKPVVKLELLSQFIGVATMVGLAFRYRSVWALAVGGIATSIGRLVLSHTMLPGERDRFGWERHALRELFSFGKWVFVSSSFTFLARVLDRLLFGKLISMAALGVYGVAANLCAMPIELIGSIGTQVMFPLYSRVLGQGGHAELKKQLVELRRPLMITSGWILAGFIAGGSTLIEILFDARFHAAGEMLQLLAFGGWFGILEVISSAALWAIGKPRAATIGNAVKAAAVLVLLPLGFHAGGITGGIWAIAAAEFLKYVACAYQLVRNDLGTLAQDGRCTLALIATAAAGLFTVHLLIGSHPIVRLIAMTCVVTAGWSPVLVPACRALLRQRSAAASSTSGFIW